MRRGLRSDRNNERLLPRWITRNDRKGRRNGASDTGVYNHVRAEKSRTGQGQGGKEKRFVNQLDICQGWVRAKRECR